MYISGGKCSSTDNSTHDVIFVLDTSGNIGYENFQLIRELVANITIGFINDSPCTAVGVILFANSAHIEFNLQAYTSLSTLLSAINQLHYSKGSETNTDKALSLLLSIAENGTLGLRQNSTKVAIVVTGGKSNDELVTISAATKLHASNIFDVYAVGVGDADLTELEAIASSPKFVFLANTFSRVGLAEMINEYLPRLLNPWFNGKCLMAAYVYM